MTAYINETSYELLPSDILIVFLPPFYEIHRTDFLHLCVTGASYAILNQGHSSLYECAQ